MKSITCYTKGEKVWIKTNILEYAELEKKVK